MPSFSSSSSSSSWASRWNFQQVALRLWEVPVAFVLLILPLLLPFAPPFALLVCAPLFMEDQLILAVQSRITYSCLDDD